MHKTIWLSILLLTLHLQSFAGKTDSIATSVFTLIYHEELEAAEQELIIQKNNLDEFYYLLLNLDLHWWKYRTERTKQNTKKLEILLQQQDETLAKNHQQKIHLLLLKSYQLRYEKRKLNLVGMLTTRAEMRSLINEIVPGDISGSADEQKLLEVYIIMFEYIEDVSFLSSQINSEQRLEKLIRMEEFASDNNEMLNTISRFFLARMYQKIENQPATGLKHFKILTTRYPGNSTFAEYQKECERKI